MKVKYASHIGGRLEQQDSFCVSCDSGDEGFVIVADGMGGHRDGKVASNLAVTAAKMCLERGDSLHETIEHTNGMIRALQPLPNRDSGMYPGTTINLVTWKRNKLSILTVGDSPIYQQTKKGLFMVNILHNNWAGGISSCLGAGFDRVPETYGCELEMKLDEKLFITTDGCDPWFNDESQCSESVEEIVVWCGIRNKAADNATCVMLSLS